MLFRSGHATERLRHRHRWRSGAAGFLALPLALAIAGPAPDSRPATLRGDAPATSVQPVLRLSPRVDHETAAAASDLFTRLLDSVGLYTLIGDLKPMSDTVPEESFRPASDEEEARLRPRYAAALAAVESDLIKARVLWRTGSKGRFASLFVLRTDLVRLEILAHPQVFAREGIGASTSATEIFDRLERMRFRDLNRIQGHLYGFPTYAVDFFCQYRPPGTPFGIGKDRQAVRIPAFQRGRDFVYVIPIAEPLSDEDRRIQEKAAAILADYRNRRPRYQAGGQLNAIALINDWHREFAPASARGPGGMSN